MAKKKPAPWSINTGTAADAAKTSVQKVEPVKEKAKTTKEKLKPGPKGTGETLKICRLTKSAHKLAKRQAFESEETLTEYLSRIVKEDYERNK